MNFLPRRSTQPELMDGDDVSLSDYQQCLADLADVNRITLTHRATLSWLEQAWAHLPAGSPVSILDVACGQGDLLRAIHRLAARRSIRVVLQGIDLNPGSAIAARQATPSGMDIDYRTGDVFACVPTPSPDFIVSSQFTHHLTDPEVLKFLLWLERNAGRGWFIADLHRHPLAYYGYPLLARLARWHPIVRYDGQISVARSFRRSDWQALLDAANIKADIRWHLPFRLCVGRLK